MFIGGTDVEVEIPVLWPPDSKSWLIGKDPDAGKDWRQEEKGTTEDEMVGWHHWLSGHGFGNWWWAGRPGVLRFMGSQRVRHNRATELNWTEHMYAHSLNRVWLSVTLWTVARQAPLSMGFPRQEYWSGLPVPPLGYVRVGKRKHIFLFFLNKKVMLGL